MRCALLNIQGLITRRMNKLDSPELIQIFRNHDLILLTETWANELCDLQVEGFECFNLNRTENKQSCKRSSGGIAVYVRNDFVCKDTLVFTCHDDIICIKLSANKLSLNHDLYFCLCYVIPENSSRQSMIEVHTLDRLLSNIVKLNSEYNNLHLVICGDMNAHTSDNPDFVADESLNHTDFLPDEYCVDNYLKRCSQDKGRINNNGNMLLDLCKQSGMRILNGRCNGDKDGKFTYVGSKGSSVVDYVITSQNMLSFVDHFGVNSPNILSDHCLIDFNFVFRKTVIQPSTTTTSSSNFNGVNYKYTWDSNCKDEFIENLSNEDVRNELDILNQHVNDCCTDTDINVCVSELSGIIHNVASPLFKRNMLPKQNDDIDLTTTSNSKWFTSECFDKRRTFYCKLNMYRRNNTEENRLNMIHARSQYKACLRKSRFNFDKCQTKKLVDSRFKNAKMYWDMLKQCAGVKHSNVSLSTFEKYFKSVNNPDSPFFNVDEDIVYFNERYEQNEFSIMFDELNLPIINIEIFQAIKELKTNKSGGPDLYLNEFFIHGKHVLAPYLLNLFNRIFDIGYFPEVWSEGYVIPLHKKGSINDENNYRGITLLSTLGKLFTRILNNRLTKWAEKYAVYIEAQAGFRSNMSTVDNIFVLHGLLTHILNKGKQLYCAFIDFSKAFDYVVRDNLWFKLIKFGIRGKILNIIKSMYSGVKSRVKYCKQLGDSFTCMLGVRQGECLSPFLFAMFLNDVENVFLEQGMNGIDVESFKLFLILYADDMVIFANNAAELQTSLDLMYEYCNRWKLIVNIDKTKVVIFRKGGRIPNDIEFLYDGKRVDVVNKFNYLGVVFSSGGSFSIAQSTISGQALKAIFKMNKHLYKFTELSVSHKMDLFDKLITPILNYASEVWGFDHGKAIERVHLQFCKQILKVKRSTQNDFVYGELGRIDFQCMRYFNIIRYWVKLLQTNENKYNKKIYLLLKSDCDRYPNRKNWCTLLKQLLCNLGFYQVWLFQDVGQPKIFLLNVKNRLKDQFIQGWNGRIQESSRASLYRHLASFRFQPYLDICNISKFRFALTRLRVSSHRLQIESGRWARPNAIPIHDRKCLECNVVEDEYHFVLECNIYTDLRTQYIPNYYRCRPNMYKFVDLLNVENPTIIKRLVVYIYKAFELRSNYNYNQ